LIKSSIKEGKNGACLRIKFIIYYFKVNNFLLSYLKQNQDQLQFLPKCQLILKNN